LRQEMGRWEIAGGKSADKTYVAATVIFLGIRCRCIWQIFWIANPFLDHFE
jgi:hypothetical protein